MSKAREVERKWWNDFQWRIKDPELRSLRQEYYEAAIFLGLRSTEFMPAATQLSVCVEKILDRVATLTGADLRIAQDKPPRPEAPDPPNPHRRST